MSSNIAWHDEIKSKTLSRRLHKIDEINNERIFTLVGEDNTSFYDHWFTLEDFNECDREKVIVGAEFYEHIRRVWYKDGSVVRATKLEFNKDTP